MRKSEIIIIYNRKKCGKIYVAFNHLKRIPHNIYLEKKKIQKIHEPYLVPILVVINNQYQFVHFK